MAVSAPARRACLPGIDRLEDRRMLSVYVVNSLADYLTPPPGTKAGTLTLRQAIQMANESAGTGVSNTIELSVAGTYQVTSVSNDPTDNSSGEFAIVGAVGYSLTITNTSAGRAVIDGGGLNRVFDINPDDDAVATSVTFQGMTITDGYADGNGGGIQAQGGVGVTLDEVDVEGNSASGYGGGVYVTGGGLTIEDSAIEDNRADSGGGVYSQVNTTITGSFIQDDDANQTGGGLFVDGNTVSATGTRFDGDVAPQGGAIGDEAASLSLQYCTVDQDEALGTTSLGFGGQGGGLYVPAAAPAGASVTIVSSLFLNDAAHYGNMGAGGAIFQQAGNLTVTNSQLSDDRSDDLGGTLFFAGQTLYINGTTIDHGRSNGEGGALYFAGTGTGAAGSRLTNDTLAFDSAYDAGGGIEDADGDLALVNDTINGGYAQNGGGIDMSTPGVLAIENTIIAQNTAFDNAQGPDVRTEGGDQVTDDGGDLVGNDSGSAGFNVSTLIGTAANPINPGLAPLLDNGSLAPYTSYGAGIWYYAGAPASLQVVQTEALLTTSPAFGAGVAVAAPSVDERGFPRPANPAIGAYQPQYSASATPSQVYVENLFEILLNRPAGAAGLAYWAPQVQAGANNPAVVMGIENSTEYRGDQITLYFEAYLGRQPGADGLSYFENVLAGGAPLAQVKFSVLGSPEYASDHGNNAFGIVESLYENVLNRVPVASEVDGWLRYLQAGGAETGMAEGFVMSQEELTDLILAEYPAGLGRVPATSEVSAALGVLSATSKPNEILDEGVLGSLETFLLRTNGSA